MDDSFLRILGDVVEGKARISQNFGLGLKEKRHAIKGHMLLELRGPDGELKARRESPIDGNTLTVLHDATVADRMAGGADALVDYTGIGTTSGGKTTASTQLEAQTARVQNDSNTQGAGAADNDVVHVATFAAGVGDGAIVEAGLFATLATATLHAYQEFAAVNKGAADTLTVTWTIQYGAS